MNPSLKELGAPWARRDSTDLLLHGPAGDLEILIDTPAQMPCGIALVAHPQPLLGGSARHKIPHVLARSIRDAGWLSVRPNFRGVGRSAGQHDHGQGESEDLLWLVSELRQTFADLPLALLGFSFGAFAQSLVAHRLAEAGAPADFVGLVGLPVGQVPAGRRYDTPALPAGSFLVHGEADESAPLGSLLAWARPQSLPVVVVPGADHFLTGHLPLLTGLLDDALAISQRLRA